MTVDSKIRLQIPILMLCIGVLSGCVTIEPLTDEEKHRFSRVAVVSTLGDVFSGNERPYSSVFSKSSKFVYAVDFNDEFVEAVIAHLAGKVPFEVGTLSEFNPTKFSNEFISSKRVSRIQMISRIVRAAGFDGMIFVQGHDFVQGDRFAGNVYDFNELGICFEKMPFKDERHLNVFPISTYISWMQSRKRHYFGITVLARSERMCSWTLGLLQRKHWILISGRPSSTRASA